jgi:HK97 family phage prohead protease
MKLKHRNVPFRIKAIEKTGEFSGYLSVFGNADSYRDVVKPGAFKDSLDDWAKQGALPPILWQHDSRQPIGPYTRMDEDDKGLYVEGSLLIDDVPQAKIAHSLLKAKVIRGQSIGYQVDEEEYDGKTNVNNLLKVSLWEGSIVTFPANIEASVTAIKSILSDGELPSLREFEEHLRDVGFSRSQAKAIASGGLTKLLSQREAGPEVDAIADFISNFQPTI